MLSAQIPTPDEDKGLPDECPDRELIAQQIAEGASIEDAYEFRCRGCTLDIECPFYDSRRDRQVTHEQNLEIELLNFRIRLAVSIVGFLGFLVCVVLAWQGIADAKHIDYSYPTWITEIFRSVIEMCVQSALVAVGAGALAFENLHKAKQIRKHDTEEKLIKNS